MSLEHKILICGAGPTGLMLAAQLALYGVKLVIIDKKEDVTTLSKAAALQARSLEIFEDMGLAKRALEKGVKLKGMQFFEKDQKLGGISFEGLRSKYDYLLGISQEETERLLCEKLLSYGQEVLWKHELIELEIEEGETFAKIKSENGEIKKEGPFTYVLGCDGIHSKVRDIAKIPFLGSDLKETFALADIQIEDGPIKDFGLAYLGQNGVALFFPLPDHHVRLILNNVKQTDQNLDQAYFESIISKRTGQVFQIKKLIWGSHFFIHYKKARRFKEKNLILAGDAGHVHSPAGGQGMNTGLQDAYNLAWRLVFVLRQDSDPELLEDYCIEREYTAKELLDMTESMTKAVTIKNFIARWFRKQLIKILLPLPFLQKAIRERISQISINYSGLCTIRESRASFFRKDAKSYNQGLKAGFRIENSELIKLSDQVKTDLQSIVNQSCKGFVLVFLGEYELSDTLGKELKKLSELTSFASREAVVEILFITKDKESKATLNLVKNVYFDPGGKLHKSYGGDIPCTYGIRPDKYIGFRFPKISKKQTLDNLEAIYKTNKLF